MPRNKDLKRLVRARMRKTGEAYTTARAQLLKRRRTTRAATTTRRPAATAPAPASDVKEYAALAGMSDAVIREKTGCSWEKWVKSLDHYGAAEMSHGDIAKLVQTKYKVGSWWTQTVTVGYERIKGLRTRGQQRNGTYQMTKSRTFNVPVSTLFEAWHDAATRRRWLGVDGVKVRTATAPKSMRLDWSDGGIVAVGFLPKGAGKSSVAIEHTKLPDREIAERLKDDWAKRFDALADVLAG